MILGYAGYPYVKWNNSKPCHRYTKTFGVVRYSGSRINEILPAAFSICPSPKMTILFLAQRGDSIRGRVRPSACQKRATCKPTMSDLGLINCIRPCFKLILIDVSQNSLCVLPAHTILSRQIYQAS